MINEQIRAKEVRLIGAENDQLGIVSLVEANRLADEAGLDLAMISPKAEPPVCKIMDYSKYKFDQAKKAKEARKKQKIVDIKEIRLSPNIDKHDVEVKAKQATKFLQDGDRVKVTMRFRGRELGHTDIGKNILNSFAESIAEYGVVEKQAKMEARSLSMFIAPKADNK